MKPLKLEKNPPTAVRASSRPEWSPRIAEKLQDAVESYNLPDTGDWQPLDELSTATQFEEIYVFPESTVYRQGVFSAPATVGVTLNYGDKHDYSTMADSYPAEVEFTIDGGRKEPVISIKRVNVDTRSFYE